MRKCVFGLAVVLASAWLLWLIDAGLEFGWPPIVMRNWQQFGLMNLHGAMICNPAGFEAASQPDSTRRLRANGNQSNA